VYLAGEVRLWSRNGKDFTAKFPDIQAALSQTPPGIALPPTARPGAVFCGLMTDC
jgi:hypothetical protein